MYRAKPIIRRPAVQPASKQFTASTTQSPRKERPTWLIPVLFMVATLVLGGLYVLTSSDTTVHTFEFVRDAAEIKLAPASKEALTEQLIIQLRNGDGLQVKFAETFRGRTIWQQELKLPKWNRFEKSIATRPTRTAAVHKLVEEFDSAGKEWTNHHPLELVYEVSLDTSDGITTADRNLVLDRMEKLGIESRLKAGDNVELYTFQFGSEDYLHYETTVVRGGSAAGYNGVKKALIDMTQPHPKQQSTSLAAIFNALGKNHGKKYRTFGAKGHLWLVELP